MLEGGVWMSGMRLEECIDKERNLLVLCIDKIEHFSYKIKSNLHQI